MSLNTILSLFIQLFFYQYLLHLNFLILAWLDEWMRIDLFLFFWFHISDFVRKGVFPNIHRYGRSLWGNEGWMLYFFLQCEHPFYPLQWCPFLEKNVISNLTDTNGKPSHYILRVTTTFSLSDDRLYIRHIKKTHHYVNDHFQEIYQADETLWLEGK